MIASVVAAWRRLRTTGRRGLVAALGIALAGAMAGAAVQVAYGLHTGFDRAADRADLPDVVANFAPQDRQRIDGLIAALPNVAARAYRSTNQDVRMRAGSHTSAKGDFELVDTSARRGYDVVAGRDLDPARGDVLVERGLADAWHLHPGDTITLPRFRTFRIRGVFVQPDNVAFPLSSAPRVYLPLQWVRARFGGGRPFAVDEALVWTRDAARTDVTLQQARATTASVRDLRFVTRSGVRVLIDAAAGIVIALLGAFSLVAVGAAGIMLAAQAGADVQRGLAGIGVQRAIGVPRGRVAAEFGLGAAALGLLAGGTGVALGALAVAGPSARLLHALNELPPGTASLPWLALTVVALAALAGAAAAWPAWRAAGRPPVALLRGAELAASAAARGRRVARGPLARLGAVPAALGARLLLARRARFALSLSVLAASGATILLMLGLGSLLESLRDDPGSVGKRYQLTARLPADRVGDVEALPGVAAASPRYVVQGVDSFALGEPVKLLALPGDHTRFEDPPRAAGRDERTAGEAEIGTGLASSLGIGPGATLAVQLPSGPEVRFHVTGTVRSLDQDGRVAYVRPDRLLAADPDLPAEIVVRLKRGASRAAVTRELSAIGAAPTVVGGATTRSGAFLGILADLLRVVAILDALVCLFALVQALGLTARERRPTLAVLRAAGAPTSTIAGVLAGAGLVLAIPAAVVAVLLERLVLAPLVGRLAAGYADLGAGASGLQSAAVVVAFAVLAVLAAGWVARRIAAEPPVLGLREE